MDKRSAKGSLHRKTTCVISFTFYFFFLISICLRLFDQTIDFVAFINAMSSLVQPAFVGANHRGMVPAHFKWNGARATFETNSCHGSANEVNFLEHVQVTLTISYPVRGNLEIVLLSPASKCRIFNP